MSFQEAKPSAPPNDIQALIQEVKALRTALDRTTFVGLRIQLVLYRLGQQQSTVNLARDRARNAEMQLSQLKNHREHLAARIKEMEQRKPGSEKAVEKELLYAKTEVEALSRHQQESETMMIDSQQTLRVETAKLDDLNRQLDELERRLAEVSK